VSRTHSECPYRCLLTLANGGAIPPTSGILDKGYTLAPELDIMTSSKLLNGFTMSLAFTCESTLSEDPLNTATFEFDVTFEDECYNANVFEPIVYDYTVPLYAPAAVSFTPSLVSMSCGAVYTEIVSVTPTNEFTPGFTVDDTNGLIIFDPATRPQAQTYTIYIRSCIFI